MPYISNGATFWVAQSLPSAYTSGGYAALTWTQIRGVRALGDIGAQYETVAIPAIGEIRRLQRRGGLVDSALPLELIRIVDAGQTILLAGVALAATSYSYKVVQTDGTLLYFTALATSRMHGGLTPGSIADLKVSLAIDSEIVEV